MHNLLFLSLLIIVPNTFALSLKHQAGPVTGAIAGATVTAGVTQISNMISGKLRSITITIENKTPFEMINPRFFFNTGGFQVLPPNTIYQGQAGVFGVASKGGLYGVQGVVVYQIGGNDFITYFNNPFTGGNWHAVRVWGGVQDAKSRFYQLWKSGTKANNYSNYSGGDWSGRSLMGSGNNAFLTSTCQHP